MQNESNKLEWNWHPKLPFDDWFGSFHEWRFGWISHAI